MYKGIKIMIRYIMFFLAISIFFMMTDVSSAMLQVSTIDYQPTQDESSTITFSDINRAYFISISIEPTMEDMFDFTRILRETYQSEINSKEFVTGLVMMNRIHGIPFAKWFLDMVTK